MIYKLIRRIFSKLDPLGSAVSCYFMRNAGLEIGDNVKRHGTPLLPIYKESHVKIDNNTTLRTRSRGHAIGINYRIALTKHSSEARIEIGNHVRMSGGAICRKHRVTIGNYTLLGANTIIVDNDMHAVKPKNRRYNNNSDIPAREVRIGSNLWIGADVFICKGVTVGDNTVIGTARYWFSSTESMVIV